jgi:hypothetical protein
MLKAAEQIANSAASANRCAEGIAEVSEGYTGNRCQAGKPALCERTGYDIDDTGAQRRCKHEARYKEGGQPGTGNQKLAHLEHSVLWLVGEKSTVVTYRYNEVAVKIKNP